VLVLVVIPAARPGGSVVVLVVLDPAPRPGGRDGLLVDDLELGRGRDGDRVAALGALDLLAGGGVRGVQPGPAGAGEGDGHGSSAVGTWVAELYRAAVGPSRVRCQRSSASSPFMITPSMSSVWAAGSAGRPESRFVRMVP